MMIWMLAAGLVRRRRQAENQAEKSWRGAPALVALSLAGPRAMSAEESSRLGQFALQFLH